MRVINEQDVFDIIDDLRDRMTVEGYCAMVERIKALPSAQPETHACDCISRRQAIDALVNWAESHHETPDGDDCIMIILDVPSAQPEMRHCVNCGRTVNNGGWYKDGRTRCPIEEHYALPKDGYCHLWEKRNVTDDDYPERREE